MTTPIYKLLIFIKRRPGMSVKEFRDYYENSHSKLGERIMATGSATIKYARRYVEPLPDGELDFDVITELWFNDRAYFEQVANTVPRGGISAEVLEDEKRFMDRTKTRFATIVECESKL